MDKKVLIASLLFVLCNLSYAESDPNAYRKLYPVPDNLTCGENEFVDKCTGTCHPTCLTGDSVPCVKACTPPVCACDWGLVRDPATNKCVKREKCTVKPAPKLSKELTSEAPNRVKRTAAEPDPMLIIGDPCWRKYCEAGTHCRYERTMCMYPPCPIFAQCVRNETSTGGLGEPIRSCFYHACGEGTVCQLKQIKYCWIPPCPWRETCVPAPIKKTTVVTTPRPAVETTMQYESILNPCRRHRCEAGTVCENQQIIMCENYPCQATPVCVPKQKTTAATPRPVDKLTTSYVDPIFYNPCLRHSCRARTVCENQQLIFCEFPPCPLTAVCVPRRGTPF